MYILRALRATLGGMSATEVIIIIITTTATAPTESRALTKILVVRFLIALNVE